jgi:hypothetical protein
VGVGGAEHTDGSCINASPTLTLPAKRSGKLTIAYSLLPPLPFHTHTLTSSGCIVVRALDTSAATSARRRGASAPSPCPSGFTSAATSLASCRQRA